MVKHLLSKKGVHALAYPAHGASVPWLCLLKILHSDVRFALSLEYSAIVDGKPQLITLRYEGDNLIPGKMSLGDRAICVSVEMLSQILRQGNPELQILLLTLRQPCSVWYPKEADRLSADFPGLLTLARATEVCICFDTKWLGDVNAAQLRAIVEGSEELVGIPHSRQFTNSYRKADWSVLNFISKAEPAAHLPTEDLKSRAIPSIEDTEARESPVQGVIPEDPPLYEEVPNKRPSHSDPSPTSGIPKKRFRYSSYSPAPTEVATPGSLSSSASTVKVDIFQDTVTSAVEKALPDVFGKFFREMCASHSPSQSPLPTNGTPIPNTRTQHDRTASHYSAFRVIFNRICTRIVTQALDEALKKPSKKALDEALNKALEEASEKAFDQASEIYNSISIEIVERFSDSMLELTTVGETHQFDFNEFCNQKIIELKQCVQELEEKRDEVVLETWDKLDAVGKQTLSRHGCLPNADGRRSALEQSSRAKSLPL